MRRVFFLLLLFVSINAQAQNRYPDTYQLEKINLPDPVPMEKRLPSKKADTSKVIYLARLSLSFTFYQAEKGVAYGQQGIALARKLEYKEGIADCSQSLAWGLWGVGNYSAALQVALEALHIYEGVNDEARIANNYILLANIYRDFGDYNRALANAKKGAALFQKLKIPDMMGNAVLGSIYDLQNRMDSASLYIRNAVAIDLQINKGQWGWLYYLEGNIHRKQKRYDSAMLFYRTALPLVDYKDIVETYNGIALLYMETGRTDSAIFYASEVIQKWQSVSYQRGILQAATILADAYRKVHQRDSLIKYLDVSIALNNKLFNQQKERDIQNMAFNEQMREDELVRQRAAYRSKLTTYALIAAGIFFLSIALLLYRNNKHRQKAYALLQQQKAQTEQALQDLKATQAQLIQSEKMASLGELTAGIAHEIQNPLNFVNNFSDVNTELLDELKVELLSGNTEEAIALAADLKENEQKINLHGKRADAIVKGMLQHSRKSTGQKEPVAINKLTDEYLWLSYHGFRAKDKSFNATIHTHFDETMETIHVVPQDIGRVLLNLFNNAFYAVHERLTKLDEEYQPTIWVNTKKRADKIEITVKDNGMGISKSLQDKIFQPFFTTKPTGQGTGLGLSLSYDIIKAHGGEISIKSEEGQYTVFTIQLPLVQ